MVYVLHFQEKLLFYLSILSPFKTKGPFLLFLSISWYIGLEQTMHSFTNRDFFHPDERFLQISLSVQNIRSVLMFNKSQVSCKTQDGGLVTAKSCRLCSSYFLNPNIQSPANYTYVLTKATTSLVHTTEQQGNLNH